MPTVWISRPRHRASELAAALMENQLTPLIYPAVQISEPPDATALSNYLAAPHDFDLHIFVSAEAASRVALQLPAGDYTLPALAIGHQTAIALAAHYQLLQPPAITTTDSKQLLQMPLLRRRCGKIAVLGGVDMHGTAPSPYLCDTLLERGNTVTPVPCYHRGAVDNAALPALGRQGKVNAAVAYSGDTLRFMLQMAAPDNDWLRQLPLFVIHPNIAQTAQTLLFQEVITTDSSRMAQCIKKYFCARA